MPSSFHQVVAVIALAVITWVLVLSAGYYMQPFFGRASADPAAGRVEVDQLACIGRAVEGMTTAGEGVRLQVENDDVYLQQRVSELIYPRVNLVQHQDAPLLTVGVTPNDLVDATLCGEVRIWIDRGR